MQDHTCHEPSPACQIAKSTTCWSGRLSYAPRSGLEATCQKSPTIWGASFPAEALGDTPVPTREPSRWSPTSPAATTPVASTRPFAPAHAAASPHPISKTGPVYVDAHLMGATIAFTRACSGARGTAPVNGSLAAIGATGVPVPPRSQRAPAAAPG